MSAEKRLKLQRRRRKFRVRGGLNSTGVKNRISVFRSSKHIVAQIIDDAARKTLASFSSVQLKDVKGDKTAIAKHVGVELGKIAVEKGISEVFFDRGGYLYHGRVQALADGLRESKLKF